MVKIILDNGTYKLKNFGDVAMLQVATERLSKLLSPTTIKIVTSSPEILSSYFPQAQPLQSSGRDLYLQPWNILGGINKLLPPQVHDYVLEQEYKLRYNFPELTLPWIKYRLKNREYKFYLIDEFLENIADAQLVVATGGGYLNDSFPKHTEIILKTLQLAQKLKKPTALLGQGIGPLNNERLRNLASQVFRQVNLIGIREDKLGISILSELGVPKERVFVTGDDAIELVYKNKTEIQGTDIGVNLRISSYSPVGEKQIDTIRTVLFNFVQKNSSNIQPVPISFYEKESDVKSIAKLLNQPRENLENKNKHHWIEPEKLIKSVGNCRIVVTVSYHAGVFALSQGIPIVGLAKSSYYVAKFTGLQHQFGQGVELVFMDSPSLKDDLTLAIEKTWKIAETVRPRLLEAAQRQIEQGNNFYQKVAELTY